MTRSFPLASSCTPISGRCLLVLACCAAVAGAQGLPDSPAGRTVAPPLDNPSGPTRGVPALPTPPLARKPWRLADRLGLPAWIELRLAHRSRYEALDEEFRANRDGHNKLLAMRTLLAVTLRNEAWRVTAEMIDSRQYGAPDDGFLNTTIVDAFDLLQGHVGWRGASVFADGDSLDVLAGRHTMDLGKRRLVARNRYRNTINAFTGLNATWRTANDASLQAFAVLPVQRLPNDADLLRDNEVEFDEEQDGTLFVGLFGTLPLAENGHQAEAYLFGLNEDDRRDAPTRNRDLWTLGGRLVKPAVPRRFGYEWESALQFGESRSSANAANTTNLDHFAQFHHLSAGYRFRGDLKPYLEGQIDYASGDDDPNDDENNRFDTLFGARRFEFGPTGILGAFARSNIVSPGLSLTVQPEEKTRVRIAHRFHWLASDQDAWTTSGLVDPTGDAGSYVGQFAELSVRHDVVPQNVRLEVGLAHLWAGDFVEDAPNNTGQGDVTYFYFATSFTL